MAKVLIVDDNEQNIEITKDLLSTWGYEVYIAKQGGKALDLANTYNPDVILLDVMLPGMNGFEICKKLKSNISTESIPIIMLTVLNEVDDRIRGFNAGADVFLSKPIIYQELKNRVAWAVNTKKIYSNMEHTDQIAKSFLNIMKLKDNKLYLHSCNVKNYCKKVGKLMLVTDENMDKLLIGALLHDIGKIVSDEVDKHIEYGLDIISPLNLNKWLQGFIRNHHEQLNGQGFPDGLRGKDMSLELKIIITINRFVELFEQLESKEASIVALSDECEKGCWSLEVLDALKQVLKDENFIKSIDGDLSSKM